MISVSNISRSMQFTRGRRTLASILLRGVKHRIYLLRAMKGQPSTALEVVSWAKQQFLQEVGKPDGSIGLAKAALLIALEEEAAAQLDRIGTPGRTGATASTWSLNRLDALAAEVINHLQQEHPQTVESTSNCSMDETDTTVAAPASSRSSRRVAKLQEKFTVLAHQYPMQVLMAVNSVLFVRHGYSACDRYGTPSDSQLAAVLERGPGSCAALTVLYLEVCRRLGLQLGFKVLENGRYCLAWPKTDSEQRPLTAAGQACVLDVYGKGALLTVREATELFAISEEELFAGSSKRELLAALLAEQQHSHWCSAIGCSPQPIFMTPLSAATAVNRKVRQLNGLSIERATASAEKRVALLPGDLNVQLDLALLCYFSGRYEDAWLELGSYVEAVRRRTSSSTAAGAASADQEHPDPVAVANTAAGSTVGGLLASNSAAGMQSVATATLTMETSTEADESAESSSAAPNMEASGELGDVLLLFEQLCLELMMQASPPASA